MAGKTAIVIKETEQELAELLRQEKQPNNKERLQVLYWLKQQQHPTVTEIARALGRNRCTVQKWLTVYRKKGVDGMLERKPIPNPHVRVIPKWAETALAKRLQEPEGFKSYGAVKQWLAEKLGVEATYHAVYQMTRYRLKAKLKVARPQNSKQNPNQLEAFKKTLSMTLSY
jgi:transposase